ncbi:DUF6932 family protein [Anaerosolibacter sp.]|uniref:DUF6932 family protein n=1 Tax=Anaerosolibacter sp. TaxID=1872527 RepID=UPI0039EF160F
MPIPAFNENGLLPEGLYDCTIQELEDIFAKIPDMDVRRDLFDRLLKYIDQIKAAEIPCKHLIIDGSYVTTKEEPSDIDLAIITPFDYTPKTYTKDHYEVMFKDMVKKKYGFNVFPVFYEAGCLDEIIEFFKGIKPPNQNLRKGILRVRI